MKKLFLILSVVYFCFSIPIFAAEQCDHAIMPYGQYDPLLVVVLMVKDEAHVMEATLQPYVDAGVKAFEILDTGSTDNTIQVTHDFFKKHGITDYYIDESPFVDFATSRNVSLDKAEEHFPKACFMLMVDAEWYMHNVEGLIAFCQAEAYKQTKCYFIRLFTTTLDYYLPRMMRCRNHVRYVGVVHETVDLLVDGKAPAEIWFDVRTTERGEEKSRKRWIRDRDMLLKYLEKYPESIRDTFYLAQTFSCLKDWHNAYKYYQIRSKMNGWEEENYMAWYRMGQMAEVMSLQDHETWWPRALQHYLKAYAIRPCRAEPLILIAYHYLVRKEFVLAHHFIKRAVEIPYPNYDILFVEKDLYTYHRYDILSQSALSVGAIQEGEWATRKALEANPNASHLYRNLALYLELAQKIKQQIAQQQSARVSSNAIV